jgi:hypothetical protein
MNRDFATAGVGGESQPAPLQKSYLFEVHQLQ